MIMTGFGGWVALVWVAPLGAFFGVAQAFGVTSQTQASRAQTDTNPRFVHHVEHVGEPVTRFADQFTNTAVVFAKGKDGVRGATVAHFVVQADQAHVIGSPHVTLSINAALWDDKDGDAFGARWRAVNPAQHEVHNVVTKLVIAC